VGELKIYLPEGLKREFKKRPVEAFGYGRRLISKAAEEAIRRWVSERERIMETAPPADPVGGLRGILGNVDESSIELQHEAGRIRAERA
jgi:hypothetical protein